MKLAVDGMGGDNAPQAIVEGVLMALDDFQNLEILLYGDEQKMTPYLKQHNRLQVVHCTEVVEAEDDPARAVRRKKTLQWLECLRLWPRGQLMRAYLQETLVH